MPASRRAVVVPGLYRPAPGTCHAVAARGLVYTAGVLPLDAEGRVVGAGDAEKQADCVFRNLDDILKASGATWGEVVVISSVDAAVLVVGTAIGLGPNFPLVCIYGCTRRGCSCSRCVLRSAGPEG